MLRKDFANKVSKVVVKIGSAVLATPDEGIHSEKIRGLATEIAALMAKKVKVVLVSSGAIAVGRETMGMTRRIEGIPEKQAAAAIGQPRLMALYDTFFREKKVQVSQILLTRDDLNHRRRYLNARATIETLFRLGALPIINENDTVVVEEIKVGDNDNLSVLVAGLIQADLLVILSDTEGLFDKDPKAHADARLISRVDEINETVMCTAGGSCSPTGVGGMTVKLEAIRKAADFGVPTILANGKRKGVLSAIFAGEQVGTLFVPKKDPLSCKKQWIAYSVKPTGTVYLDSGAVKALLYGGKSLLPSGVVKAEGSFERGEGVDICNLSGEIVARGLANYNAQEIEKIHGKRSSNIRKILGYTYGDELVHRDYLVILKSITKEQDHGQYPQDG
jgi:glutamate 5-kinase